MSEMYAIKDTTLTALGDAVRNRVIGTSELPILTIDKLSMDCKKAYPNELVNVKKVKITGTIDFTGKNVSRGAQGLGIATGKYSASQYTPARNNSTILIPPIAGGEPLNASIVEFETIIEGNQWTFVLSTLDERLAVFDLNYTAIGLDENGNEFKYTPLEMAEAINDLVIPVIPEDAFTFTGDCQYKFTGNNWNWFIETYGDKITTNNLTHVNNLFHNNKTLKRIPFDINLSYNLSSGLISIFNGMYELEELPLIKGDIKPPTGDYSGNPSFQYAFYNLYKVRHIPYDYFHNFGGEEFWRVANAYTYSNRANFFSSCYSLRQLPDVSMLLTAATSSSSNFYYGFCSYCYTLDEASNLPVSVANFTSNMFSSFLTNCCRLKEITFAVNEDGTPKTANWKSQTIDLTKYIGYGSSANIFVARNSGITTDKQVKDDATYQALKDDPDWFTLDINYSRYNHDSAVNTINSLPDTSAYGTNTIKFIGKAGALTDGGAINTLTEEEIAVAAAKGWTVSFA